MSSQEILIITTFIICAFYLRVPFTGVPYGVPYFMIHVRGDATLTIGPYGSAGTCIINYAPPQINVVVMTLTIV